ncbi:MAG: histidinol-phosphate transaminase [Acidimicrobiia bacterium]
MIRTRRALDGIPRYVPGKSAESVAAEHELAEAVKLASNEAPFGPLPAAIEAAAAAMTTANRYPDNGAVALVEALAASNGVGPEQVLVGNGSVQLCQHLFLTTIEPGDEAVFGWPSFEAYPIQAQQADASMVRVPLRDHTYDLPAMAAAISDRTRLVFVCTPNNPTGTVVTRAAVEEFLAAVPSDCLVVFDEAYREFVTDPDTPDGLDLVASHRNVLVLRTFSKAYGLAALRVGYAIAQPEVIDALRKLHVPFEVNAVAQAAALASLAAEAEMRARVAVVIAERDRMYDALVARGMPVVPSQANFLWLDAPDTAVELAFHGERNGVVMRSFADIGARVTVGTAEENERVLAVLDSAREHGLI